MDGKYDLGDIVQIPIESKSFGRIATQNAKNVILQKIREEERSMQFNEWYQKEKDVVTGIVQRNFGRNVSINLGRVDAMLSEAEQVRGEIFKPTERIKVFVLEVKDTPKGPRISVSRTHPDLVKRLFEAEVAEVRDGTVEIKAIAREAGSRTKIAVWSNDPNVDPVGACVGMNGARVNSIVSELRGEKIDIITWDENAAFLIENALSPAKVICVVADEEAREAQVIVPDYQLSLAIGKEGQNARLAARLTGYKIDIKSETQARETGLFEQMGIDDQEEGVYDDFPADFDITSLDEEELSGEEELLDEEYLGESMDEGALEEAASEDYLEELEAEDEGSTEQPADGEFLERPTEEDDPEDVDGESQETAEDEEYPSSDDQMRQELSAVPDEEDYPVEDYEEQDKE